MVFPFNFTTTHAGSMPHTEAVPVCQYLACTLDIPGWPQLPRRTFHENMYAQFSRGLPGLVIDEAAEKLYFDTSTDLTPALEDFYQRYLNDDLESFGLAPAEAAGLFTMPDSLKTRPGNWIKGQVTGPVSFGLTVTDQDKRASLYNDLLADVIVKNIAMKARWQVRRLQTIRPDVLISIDEPYLASFGSAYVSLQRETVIGMLDEVFEAVHLEHALASVHCCGNTDWSLLLSTTVDFLNLDSFNFIEPLSLYPHELKSFLERGGAIAWGSVPNSEQIERFSPQELAERIWRGLDLIAARAKGRGVTLRAADLAKNSLLLPSCGLGPTSPQIAEKVIAILAETAGLARRG